MRTDNFQKCASTNQIHLNNIFIPFVITGIVSTFFIATLKQTSDKYALFKIDK